jgi:cyclopropane fatty-acyl-phospholipid synthase-like methyltransferase
MKNYPDKNWYKKWNLDIKNMSWTEETKSQVDFIVDLLKLEGHEKILDLACGFGRHSLEFARRGFSVTGVDITKAYIEDATKTAESESLNAKFILSDIREVDFYEEFDVVLNLADGAIGYLENDEENLKIFDVISRSLKPSGKHFMDVCNREHAENFFPKRHWEIGNNSVSLSEFGWDKETKSMLYGGMEMPYRKILEKPKKINYHSSIRLYSIDELATIFEEINLKIENAYTDYKYTPASPLKMQLQVYSTKRKKQNYSDQFKTIN